MKTLMLIVGMLLLSACSQGRKTDNNSGSDDTVAVRERKAVFDADTAFFHVGNQVALGPRVPGTDAHRLCGEYIARTLHRYGADTVITQRGSATMHTGKEIPLVNIMGRFNVDAPRRLLIVAHYDTRPWADAEIDQSKHDRPIPGANDGGSGVGVALELSRLVGSIKPDAGVDFLLVDAEDSGQSSGWGENDETWCLGTQYWVKNMPYRSASERPAYGIVLDMVGGDGAVFYRESLSERLAPAINTKVWGTALNSEFADRFNNAVSGSLIDDHLFINRAGIPCIDIVECNNARTGSFPPTWHTLDDDMRHIDRSTLKAVGQVVADVIYGETVSE